MQILSFKGTPQFGKAVSTRGARRKSRKKFPVAYLQRKEFASLVQILSFKGTPQFGNSVSTRGARRKSQKLFPVAYLQRKEFAPWCKFFPLKVRLSLERLFQQGEQGGSRESCSPWRTFKGKNLLLWKGCFNKGSKEEVAKVVPRGSFGANSFL